MIRLTCCIMLVSTLGVAAQDALPTAVAPYVDDQTVVIARVDLARIDLEKTFKHLVAITGDEKGAEAPKKLLSGIVADLKKAGVGEIYGLINMADITANPICLILPVAGDSAKAIEVLKAIDSVQGLTVETRNGVVIVASAAVATRLKTMKSSARPELAAALAAGKGGAVQVGIAPNADLRRVAEETMPNLSKEIGGGSIKVISRGLTWIALSLSTTPKLDLALTVQASDAAAAKSLADLAEASLKTVLKNMKGAELEAFTAAAMKTMSPAVDGDRLVSRIEEEQFVKLVGEMAKPVRVTASRQKSQNNMKQLGIAMHSYVSENGRFPTDSVDKAGKPLLSWRVHLLPYLEQEQLYKQFKLDEPWDSANNKPLIAKIPAIFIAPEQKSPAGTTTYLGPLGEGYFFRPKANGEGLKVSDITDGTSNTIMIVETADGSAIEWTKPGDWKPNQQDPMAALVGHYANGTSAAFSDGSVRFISKNDGKQLLPLLTVSGGEVAELPR